MAYYNTPTGTAKITKFDNSKTYICANWTLIHCRWEYKLVQLLIPTNAEHTHTLNPATILLLIYPIEIGI